MTRPRLTADQRRELFKNGWDVEVINHAEGLCGPWCTRCAHERNHTGCFGCPDC